MSRAELLLETKGIVLAPSTQLRAKGSMRDCTNFNIDAPGVIRTRQGFQRQGNGFGGPIWKMVTTKELAANLLINFGTGSTATGLRYGDGSAATTAIAGTVTNPPENRMRAAVSQRNHYLTSTEGIRRLETDLTLYVAGMPQGLGLDQTGPAAVLTGAPGVVLTDLFNCAYRVAVCKKDQQGLIMEGAPSARSVVYNRTGTTGYAAGITKDVVCRMLLPKAVGTANTALTTSYFIRLYRSLAIAASIAEPPDDMRLVYEKTLTSTDITNGYVEITDTVPEAFRKKSPPCHTNQNDFGEDGVGGPGIAQANLPPPAATDVALFQRCLWMSDLTYRHALEITILSVTATGLSSGDVLTIGGRTYTAVAAAPGANQFVVSAAASVAEAITRTAQNLVEAINKDASQVTVYAYYVATEAELPGRIRLEARTNNSASFGVSASAHSDAYRPALSQSSTAKTFGGGLAFSKPYQPNAVPGVNFIAVGRDDTRILCLKVLGESLYVFTDEDLYVVTGSNFFDWSIQRFADSGFRLLSREMVVECDGCLWAMGLEGVARITETDLNIVSNPIEPLLWKLSAGSSLDWMRANGWAVAYRSKHKLVFALPEGASNRNCKWTLVYDTRMEAWSTWTFPRNVDGTDGRTGACVRVSDDLLFLGLWNAGGTDSYIFKEKRTYTAADYSDEDDAGTKSAIPKVARWNVITSSPTSLSTFDELHCFWEVSATIPGWTTPTSVTATVKTDSSNSAANVAFAPAATDVMSRNMVPQGARTGVRLEVVVSHSVVDEFIGIEGAAVMLTETESSRTRTK